MFCFYHCLILDFSTNSIQIFEHNYCCALCGTMLTSVGLTKSISKCNKTCHDNINMSVKCHDTINKMNDYTCDLMILDFEIHEDRIDDMNIFQWWDSHDVNNEWFQQNFKKLETKNAQYLKIYAITNKLKKLKIKQHLQIENINTFIINANQRFAKYIDQFVQYYQYYVNNSNNDETMVECISCETNYQRQMLVHNKYVSNQQTIKMVHVLQSQSIVCNWCISKCCANIQTALLHKQLKSHNVHIMWFDLDVECWRYGKILKNITNTLNIHKLKLKIQIHAVDEYEALSTIEIAMNNMHQYQYCFWCPDCKPAKTIDATAFTFDFTNEHMMGWEHSQNSFHTDWQIPLLNTINGIKMINFEYVRNNVQLWKHLRKYY